MVNTVIRMAIQISIWYQNLYIFDHSEDGLVLQLGIAHHQSNHGIKLPLK